MPLFVLVCLVTILTCDFTIALACTKWIRRENYRTGTVLKCCAISCTPGFYVDVCTSNGTRDKCVPCPEGTFMEDPTNSSLPQRCISDECPPYSVRTDSFPSIGCRKKCRCDVIKGYVRTDPCNCHSISSGKNVNQTLHNGGSKESKTASTNEDLLEESKNKSLQTTTERFLINTTKGKDKKIYLNVKLETVLWIIGGIFVVIGLILIAVCCCMRGKCCKKCKEQHPKALQCPYQAPPSTERPQRPEARVPPFINEGAELNNEGSQPFLSPDDNNTHAGRSVHHEERPPGQTHSHAISMQGYHRYLRPAPSLDPNSIHADRQQWVDFSEGVNINSVHFEDQSQSENYSFPTEETDDATAI